MLATALLLGGCGDGASTSGPTVGPAADTSTRTPDAGSPPSSTSRSGASEHAADEAVVVVQDWLGALRDGDLAAARVGLGEASAQAIESAGGLEGLASGLSEGMAAFVDADAQWTATAVPGHSETLVVTAVGEVEREGLVETAAHAWLVHPEGGRPVVEAFSPHPPEVVRPVPNGPLPLGQPVEAHLAPGSVHVVVDGAVLPEGVTVEPTDGDRVRVEVLPGGGWAPGRRTVTLVSVPPEAAGARPWAATAVTFEAS